MFGTYSVTDSGGFSVFYGFFTESKNCEKIKQNQL